MVDLTCNAVDDRHSEQLRLVVDDVPGARVRAVSDRTLPAPSGGEARGRPEGPPEDEGRSVDGLHPRRGAGLPGDRADPSAVRNLTIKRNTVAVVTDGSAVLGLGDIGPSAALPVMEGKALLFKRFADIDAWPVCLATKDADEIVRTVELIAPVFGGINLEDIAAPRCFEIERRLRESLDIPVFHDDQHGTAVVVLAALMNALGRRQAHEDLRVVILGVGAAGVAITKILLAAGIGDVVGRRPSGDPHGGVPGPRRGRARWIAAHTNLEGRAGGLDEAVERRRRVHRRVSGRTCCARSTWRSSPRTPSSSHWPIPIRRSTP